MTTAVLTQPRRELTSLTAEPERRLLLFLAARVPAGIGPDHLTALGLAAMLAAGAAYAVRTPRDRPTFVKAATPRSIWAGVWAAETCTRMRESPRGTTGKKNPFT